MIRTLGRLFVTNDIGGRFADPACNGAEPGLVPAPFARIAAHLTVVAGQSDSPFVYDAGNLLSPHGVTRYALESQPERLADLVSAFGYRALALGSRDLAAPRNGVVATAKALWDRGIPMLASNLRCTRPGDPLCEVLVDGDDGLSVHRFGNRRLALVALLPQAILDAVPRDRLDGIRLLDPAATLARAVRLARGVGDDVFVVASIDLVAGEDPSAEALRLIGGMAPGDRPDLLVVGGAGEELLFARPASYAPPLVSPRPGGLLELRIRENLSTESFDILALPQEPRSLAALPVLEWIDDLGPAYCDALGGPLEGGRLAEPMDSEALVRLAGDVARASVRAEVAVLPDRLVESSWKRDAGERLTSSDVRVGLRYGADLVRARVPTSWLVALQEKASPRLIVRGLSGRGNALQVNGRPAEPRGSYRVVTTRFLASGGYGALPPGARWEPTDQTIQQLTRSWLGRPRAADPRRAIRDPAQAVEWEVGATVDVTFDGTQVSNPGDVYEASQLTGSDNINFGGRLQLEIDAVHPKWSWENDLNLNYAVNLLDDERSNPTDLVQLRTSFFYRGLRGPGSPFYVPELFVENLFETELTTPAADERADDRDDEPQDPTLRDYYRLFFRPVIGARFPLTQLFSVKAGFSVELERVQRSVRREGNNVPVVRLPGGGAQLTADVRPGFNGQLRLARTTVIAEGQRSLTTRFLFDANVSNFIPTGSQTRGRSTQLRATTDFALQITGPFSLTLTYDLFYQRDALEDDFGLYLRGTVALTVSSLARGLFW